MTNLWRGIVSTTSQQLPNAKNPESIKTVGAKDVRTCPRCKNEIIARENYVFCPRCKKSLRRVAKQVKAKAPSVIVLKTIGKDGFCSIEKIARAPKKLKTRAVKIPSLNISGTKQALTKLYKEKKSKSAKQAKAKRTKAEKMISIPSLGINGLMASSNLPTIELINLELAKNARRKKRSDPIKAFVLSVQKPKSSTIKKINTNASDDASNAARVQMAKIQKKNKRAVQKALKVMNADQVAIAAVSERKLSHLERELLSTYRISSIVETKSQPVITPEQIAKEKKQKEIAELRSIAAQVRPIVVYKPTAPNGAVSQ